MTPNCDPRTKGLFSIAATTLLCDTLLALQARFGTSSRNCNLPYGGLKSSQLSNPWVSGAAVVTAGLAVVACGMGMLECHRKMRRINVTTSAELQAQVNANVELVTSGKGNFAVRITIDQNKSGITWGDNMFNDCGLDNESLTADQAYQILDMITCSDTAGHSDTHSDDGWFVEATMRNNFIDEINSSRTKDLMTYEYASMGLW